MAINKTIFTADRTAQKSEILAWLQANATNYFDSIETDTDGNISCRLENGAELLFMFDTSAAICKITSKTQQSASIFSSSSGNAYTRTGIVTSNGIMLISNAGSSSLENIMIISKTNNGSTAILTFHRALSSSNNQQNYFIDLDNDSECLTKNFQIISVPATSLAPVCFASGNYCEHVFMTLFSQFTNSSCIMQINGKKYAYGGYLALEE